MRNFSFILFAFCLISGYSILTAAPSHAQESGMKNTSNTCNVPRDNEPLADTDDRWKYCNIHMRQFAYREKHIELKDMLEARAENYKASSQWAKEQYKEELEKYHAGLGND